MKVKLISMTENPIDLMWTAARTCYSEKSPIEIWEEENRYPKLKGNDAITDEYYNEMQNKMWNLVKAVLDSGHESIAESIKFTFVIEGVSRALLAQITRHRIGVVFSVQSQRYVEFKESYNTIAEALDNGTEQQEKYLKALAEKYFVGVTSDNYRDYMNLLLSYLGMIKRGIKPEDARMILPNATKTNITMTINLRELMHTSNLRLCNRAQTEIRNLFKMFKDEINKKNEKLSSLLVPSCEKYGACFEYSCCGRKPKMNEVLSVYNLLSNDVSFNKDFDIIIENIKNSKVKENLKSLLKVESMDKE